MPSKTNIQLDSAVNVFNSNIFHYSNEPSSFENEVERQSPMNIMGKKGGGNLRSSFTPFSPQENIKS